MRTREHNSLDRKIGVVIVHYGDRALTRAAVARLLGQLPDMQVVVADHGPQQGPEASVTDEPWPPRGAQTVGAGLENPGFAVGANRCMEVLGPQPYALVLNPDVEVDSGTLALMCTVLDALPGTAVATPTLLVADGRIWYGGGRIARWRGIATHEGFGQRWNPPNGRTPRHRAVGFVPLAAALVRRSALAQVGGVPEGWFLYWEDVDLSERLSASGWDLRVLPGVAAVHQRGQYGDELRNLSATMLYHQARNRIWWCRTRLPAAQRFAALLWTAPHLGRRAMLVGRSQHDRRRRLAAMARGVLSGFGPIPSGLQWHR